MSAVECLFVCESCLPSFSFCSGNGQFSAHKVLQSTESKMISAWNILTQCSLYSSGFQRKEWFSLLSSPWQGQGEPMGVWPLAEPHWDLLTWHSSAYVSYQPYSSRGFLNVCVTHQHVWSHISAFNGCLIKNKEQYSACMSCKRGPVLFGMLSPAPENCKEQKEISEKMNRSKKEKWSIQV